MGGQFGAGQSEGRIDAAFETIARVGHDSEFAAGPGDIGRVPQSGFDQDVGGGLVAAGAFSAHHAGERFHAMIVGDDHDILIQRIGLAIEREQAFAGLAAPHHQSSGDLIGVEHMQRPAAIESQEIGDVDQGVDRTQADAFEPISQPFGARPIVHAAHQTQGDERREKSVVMGEIELRLDRKGEGAGNGRDRLFNQSADPRRREIACYAINTGGVGAIGGEVDLNQRIVKPSPERIGLAHRRVIAQLENAGGIAFKTELLGRTHHAAGFDAANHALGYGEILGRNKSARSGEDGFQPRPRIFRAADHLHRGSFADIDLADL